MAIEINRGKYRGFETVPTVVDERRIVDPVGTVVQCLELLRQLDINPKANTPEDTHHLYWPRKWYLDNDIAHSSSAACTFRNTGVNLVELPRGFHHLLHMFTAPPRMPAPELMKRYISSCHFMHLIYERAYLVADPQRLIDRAIQEYGLSYSTRNIHSVLSGAKQDLEKAKTKYRKVPKEARVIPDLEVDSAAGELVERIKNFTHGTQRLVTLALSN